MYDSKYHIVDDAMIQVVSCYKERLQKEPTITKQDQNINTKINFKSIEHVTLYAKTHHFKKRYTTYKKHYNDNINYFLLHNFHTSKF